MLSVTCFNEPDPWFSLLNLKDERIDILLVFFFFTLYRYFSTFFFFFFLQLEKGWALEILRSLFRNSLKQAFGFRNKFHVCGKPDLRSKHCVTDGRGEQAAQSQRWPQSGGSLGRLSAPSTPLPGWLPGPQCQALQLLCTGQHPRWS